MRLHVLAMQYDSEWARGLIESMIFNSPGLDSDTARYLNGIDHHYHIRNDGIFLKRSFQSGDFLPHLHTHPETENVALHSLVPREKLSVMESFDIHRYPGIMSLELRGIPLKFQKSTCTKCPMTLRKSEIQVRNHPMRTNVPKIVDVYASLHSRRVLSGCVPLTLRAALIKRSRARCPTLDDWSLTIGRDGEVTVRMDPSFREKFLVGEDTLMNMIVEMDGPMIIKAIQMKASASLRQVMETAGQVFGHIPKKLLHA